MNKVHNNDTFDMFSAKLIQCMKKCILTTKVFCCWNAHIEHASCFLHYKLKVQFGLSCLISLNLFWSRSAIKLSWQDLSIRGIFLSFSTGVLFIHSLIWTRRGPLWLETWVSLTHLSSPELWMCLLTNLLIFPTRILHKKPERNILSASLPFVRSSQEPHTVSWYSEPGRSVSCPLAHSLCSTHESSAEVDVE